MRLSIPEAREVLGRLSDFDDARLTSFLGALVPVAAAVQARKTSDQYVPVWQLSVHDARELVGSLCSLEDTTLVHYLGALVPVATAIRAQESRLVRSAKRAAAGREASWIRVVGSRKGEEADQWLRPWKYWTDADHARHVAIATEVRRQYAELRRTPSGTPMEVRAEQAREALAERFGLANGNAVLRCYYSHLVAQVYRALDIQMAGWGQDFPLTHAVDQLRGIMSQYQRCFDATPQKAREYYQLDQETYDRVTSPDFRRGDDGRFWRPFYRGPQAAPEQAVSA